MGYAVAGSVGYYCCRTGSEQLWGQGGGAGVGVASLTLDANHVNPLECSPVRCVYVQCVADHGLCLDQTALLHLVPRDRFLECTGEALRYG